LWQRELLGELSDAESVVSRQLAYWREELRDLPEQLMLPFDRPRPRVASYRGKTTVFAITSELRSAVEELARREGATESMVLQATLAVLLTKLGAGKDIPIGSPIAGRTDEALSELVGFFVNTWVLRAEVDEAASFREILRQVKEKALTAYVNQDAPFELLVELLNPIRSTAHHPLFQVSLAFQNNELSAIRLSGVDITPYDGRDGNARFDLLFNIAADSSTSMEGGGYTGFVEYATDIFDANTVATMTERYILLLGQVVARATDAVCDLSILLSTEQDDLLALGRGPVRANSTPRPDTTDRIHRLARTAPDAVAVVAAGVELTRGQLDRDAGLLAGELIARGVGVDDVVAVIVPRSPYWIVAVLGIWRAGAAYAPLDPTNPVGRNRDLMRDSGVRCVVTVRELTDTYHGDLPTIVIDGLMSSAPTVAPPELVALPRQRLAYVIFTSGSTGRPKPTAVHVEGYENTLDWYEQELADAGATVFVASSPSFDLTQKNVWVALRTGRLLTLAAPEFDAVAIVRSLSEYSGVITNLAPSAFGALVDAGIYDVLDSSSTVVLGGESISAGALPASDDRAPVLVNSYGPTEASDVVASYRLDGALDRYRHQPIPIGNAIPDVSVYILDKNLALRPRGVVGELYVGGSGVGRGYVGYAALTATRFIADPYGRRGGRLYRTGDLARWGTAGTIEYHGRVDDQVKLRGIRIEPGEIEAVLLADRRVSRAAVVVRNDRAGDQRLVGYVVAAEQAVVDVTDLRRTLSGELPAHMVPSLLMVVDDIPLTSNGKLDKRALPVPELVSDAVGQAPRTESERVVAGLFAELLGLPFERLGIHDNFFDLGGHSLLATRLISRIRTELAVEIPIRALFDAPSITGLADRITSGAAVRSAVSVRERPELLPLSFAQQRMWFIHRFEGPAATYNLPVAWRLEGVVDVAALADAVGDVVARHESLRTVFHEIAGIPFQVVLPVRDAEVPFSVESVGADDTEVLVARVSAYEFDLASELPVRVSVFGCGVDEWVLVLVIHHIACDGWSLVPLARDLSVAYAARCAGRAPVWDGLPVQYVDYALWQRELLGELSDAESVVS
ncbi:amino acid adenylation domain-containing protein, partial [Nocardia asiatica]|uniref:amino acid adenylation domain-containing protein n=1 Tax=Nocardia asiatica TaxID=209252 RepID=UPI0024568292